jgi:hypothetical protein
MKALYLNHFKAALFALLLLALQSCQVIPGTWKNGRIDAGKRDKFHEMNKEALAYLKADDPKGMKMLLSKELNANNNDREIGHISNRLNDNAYDLLDEYYVVHKYKDTDTVAAKGGDVKRYGLLYPYATTEMYFAYFIPKKTANKYMISLVYGKFDYGWKIIKMDVAPYTINGKTAPELYALAVDQLNKKKVQAAYNNITLAITCLKPGIYWQYPDEGDALKFYSRARLLVKDAYQYPLVLRQIATGPMILNVYTKDVDDGTYPLIYYMTHFDLKDTAEVKKENLQIRNIVHKIMPGLEENNKYISYAAFNKQPTGYIEVDHFDMTEKLR